MSSPSPFTVTKDGCHFEVKVDAHYVSDEEIQIVRRYITTLNDENAKLRELVRHLRECTRHNVCVLCDYADDACDFDYDMRELGVEP